MVYAAQKSAKRVMVVVDGQAGAEYDGISSLIFSADGKRVAYAAQKGAKVVGGGGRPGGPRSTTGIGKGTLIFSADGKRVGDTAQKGREAVGGGGRPERVPETTEYAPLIFSADGKRVAYVAGKDKKRFVVVDDHVSPENDDIVEGLRFQRQQADAADGAKKSDKCMVVVDGQGGARSTTLSGKTP